VLSLKTLRKD